MARKKQFGKDGEINEQNLKGIGTLLTVGWNKGE